MNLHRTWIGIGCGIWLLAAGCGGAGGNGTADMGPPTNGCSSTSQLKFAMKQVGLPVMPQYKSDVDGDGASENRFAAIIGTLEGMGIDMQSSLNSDVKSGKFLMMADMQGSSMNTGCANVVVHSGAMPTMPPKYDGTDAFQPQQGETPVTLAGNLAGGALTTTGPKDQAPAAVTQLKMMVPMHEDVQLPLTIYGVQMVGTVSGAGVMSGELHGVVRKKDIDQNVIPMVAMGLTNAINKNPTTDWSKFLIQMFEDQNNAESKTKCMSTPAMCCAKNPATCKLTSAELLGNPVVQNIIAPDVQMFSSDTWSPKPGGGTKDSLSFGVGFTAVKSAF